jgi:acyl transferase domain-containing protein
MLHLPTNKPATVFAFSGLGSQYFLMGAELFEQCAPFRAWMTRMDEFVAELTGRSVLRELYHDGRDRSDELDDTLLSHASLYMVELALARALIESGVRPDLTLGCSLGSYAALTVSGCIEYCGALQTICAAATALERSCMPGAMLAIIHSDRQQVLSLLGDRCEIACDNFPSHFVVALPRTELAWVAETLTSADILWQRLPVSFAFHSRWIEAARTQLTSFAPAACPPAGIPFVCCARSQVLTRPPSGYFWRVAREPVQFAATIGALESRNLCSYVDVGPSGTLATFLRQLLPGSARQRIVAAMNAFGHDLERLSAAVQGARRLTSVAAAH